MTVADYAAKCGLKPFAVPESEREIGGCYIGDLLSWVMGRAKADNVWITIMSNINIVAVAALTDCACIVLAEGVAADQKVIDLCNAKGVNLLGSELTAFELATRLAGLL
ncbi:MAG: hypothetical protein IJL87_02825 [Clostridia bacterium]|nr:hypothetical protein [Clostridia bacterium]